MARMLAGGVCVTVGHEPAVVSYICTSPGCYKMACGICRKQAKCCASPNFSVVPELIKNMSECNREGCHVYCSPNTLASHFHMHHEVKFPVLSSQSVFQPDMVQTKGYKQLILPHKERIASYILNHNLTQHNNVKLYDMRDDTNSIQFVFSADHISIVLAKEMGLVLWCKPMYHEEEVGNRPESKAKSNKPSSFYSDSYTNLIGETPVYQLQLYVTLLYAEDFGTETVDPLAWPRLVQCSLSTVWGLDTAPNVPTSNRLRDTGTTHNCLVVDHHPATQMPLNLSWQNPCAQSMVLPIYNLFRMTLQVRGVHPVLPMPNPTSPLCAWIKMKRYVPNPIRTWKPGMHDTASLFKLTMLTAIIIVDVYGDGKVVYELSARFQYPLAASTKVDIHVKGRCVMCKKEFASAETWLDTCIVPLIKQESKLDPPKKSSKAINASKVSKKGKQSARQSSNKKKRRVETETESKQGESITSSTSSCSLIRVFHVASRTDGMFPKCIYTKHV